MVISEWDAAFKLIVNCEKYLRKESKKAQQYHGFASSTKKSSF